MEELLQQLDSQQGPTQQADAELPPLSEAQLREIVKSYLHNYRLAKCQLDSYNKFALKDLTYIIKEQSPIVISSTAVNRCHVIEFGDVVIKSPLVQEGNGFVDSVTPDMARKRSLSYSAPVLVNIHHTVYNAADRSKATRRRTRDYVEVLLFHLPVMVGSRLCSSTRRRSLLEPNGEDPLDEGGYFITNGNEKAVLAQESICNNYVFVFEQTGASRFSHVCEIRSLHEDKTRSTSTLTLSITSPRGGAPPSILVSIPFITKMKVPLPAVFKMLGINQQTTMRHYITGSNKCHRYDSLLHLVDAVLDSEDMNSGLDGEELLEYIGREGTEEPPDKRVGYIQHLINNEMLPHVGMVASSKSGQERLDIIARNHRAKAYFLGMAVRKLLLVYSGQLPADDRDNYGDKRLATTGVSLALIFRQKLRKFVSNVTTQLKKNIDGNKHLDLVFLFHAKRITNGLNYALSTGNWTAKKGNKNQTGVAQILLRMSVPATLSHLRRISSTLNREGKLPKPRQLDPSQWGLLCPSETPEGANCGLIKIMALGMQIRLGHSLIYVRDYLLSQCFQLTPLQQLPADSNVHIEQSCVLVNGVMVGFVEEPLELVTHLRQRRRCGNLAWDTSVLYDSSMDQVRVTTDPGACLRPLLVLENLHRYAAVYREYRSLHEGDIRQLWRLLLNAGVVEFVDKKEEMTLLVAMEWAEVTPQHTHMDIHVMLLLGLCAALVPFPEHDQGPRIMYQTCMMKQSISVPCLNLGNRMDSVSYLLHYPQRPLVSTMVENMLPAVKMLPTGVNAIVAILCYTGYNVEDSVIVSQGAIDRGLLRCSAYKTYKESARGQGARINCFEKPAPDCVGRQDAVYDDLDPDGLVPPGTRCQHNHVLIGSTTEMTVMGSNARGTRNNQPDTPKRDNSTVYRELDDCVVDTVLVSNNSDGGRYHMVKVRKECIPEIGDKFSSRHGQKGVVGLVMPQEDMPFTLDGMVPDIIMNPHAFPSRMTIGQMLESILGKGCALEGSLGDGTPFQQLDMATVREKLSGRGFDGLGNETMINGRTGKLLEQPVFIGPVYFQRLKHMVGYKVHARSTGPVQSTTRQPVEGRSKDGGLRFGEMERWALEAHGASAVLKDRLMDQSDPHRTVYCEACGCLAEAAPPKHGALNPQLAARAGQPWCRHCRRSDTVREIDIPHAEKLFTQELSGLMVAQRFSHRENPQFVV
jgi:DNA-directed RNA polymerase II subunit RPB2